VVVYFQNIFAMMNMQFSGSGSQPMAGGANEPVAPNRANENDWQRDDPANFAPERTGQGRGQVMPSVPNTMGL
jgi:hypothetical protein